MAETKFMDYVSNSGRNLISEWVKEEMSPDAQEEFETILNLLRVSERKDWTRPTFRVVKGFKKISRIALKVNRIQYRILGYFGPDPNMCSLLTGWIKKRPSYQRPGKQAVQRMKRVENTRCIREHET